MDMLALEHTTTSIRMDPFFNAIGSAVAIMFIFFVSVVGGRLLASVAAKDKDSKNAITVIAALGIFLFLFFLGPKIVGK